MNGEIVKKVMKWLLVTVIVGFFAWFTVGLYRRIKDQRRGS